MRLKIYFKAEGVTRECCGIVEQADGNTYFISWFLTEEERNKIPDTHWNYSRKRDIKTSDFDYYKKGEFIIMQYDFSELAK